jgi:hypothetical protein
MIIPTHLAEVQEQSRSDSIGDAVDVLSAPHSAWLPLELANKDLVLAVTNDDGYDHMHQTDHRSAVHTRM